MEIIDGIEVFRKGDTYTVNFISGQEVVIKYNCKVNPWYAPEELESLEVNVPPIKKRQAIREALCVLNITRDTLLTDIKKGLSTSIQLVDFLSRKLGVEKEWSYLKRISCENISSLFKLVKERLPAGSWGFIPKYIEELPEDALPKEVYASLENKLKEAKELVKGSIHSALVPPGCFYELTSKAKGIIGNVMERGQGMSPEVACITYWGLVSSILKEDLDRMGVPEEEKPYVLEKVIREVVGDSNTINNNY